MMRCSFAFAILVAVFIIGCGGGGVGESITGGATGGSSTSTTTAGATTGSNNLPDLGINADLHGYRPFPADNPWNTPVDAEPVDPNSATLIASIGGAKQLHPDFGANWNGGPFGIPYMVVDHTTPGAPMSFDYADESDPGPYPFPANAPVEGGSSSTGDRHVLVLDRDAKKLYETFDSHRQSNGSWHCGSGAIFDMASNAQRPLYWTSADAAGLPIFPGLVRYDEVHAGSIDHALRFTVSHSRKAFVDPARHWASSDTSASLPPMGMRVRLKASFDVSSYPASAQVILRALKKYGMFVADNGSDWFLSGAPDSRWNDEDLNSLKQLHGSGFEVVRMGQVVTP